MTDPDAPPDGAGTSKDKDDNVHEELRKRRHGTGALTRIQVGRVAFRPKLSDTGDDIENVESMIGEESELSIT